MSQRVNRGSSAARRGKFEAIRVLGGAPQKRRPVSRVRRVRVGRNGRNLAQHALLHPLELEHDDLPLPLPQRTDAAADGDDDVEVVVFDEAVNLRGTMV